MLKVVDRSSKILWSELALTAVLILINIFHEARPMSVESCGIPKIVWQTYTSSDLPPLLLAARKRLMLENPSWRFVLMNDTECSNFMAAYFAGPTADAYASINPSFGAARADLWRYSILAVFGGLYMDIDATLLIPLDEFVKDEDCALLSTWVNWSHVGVGEGGRAPWSCFEPIACGWHRETYAYMHQHVYNEDLLWGAVNRPKDQSKLPVSPAQFLLISSPGHAFVTRAVELVTRNIQCWIDDSESSRIHTAWRILFLTGPFAWEAAVNLALDNEMTHAEHDDARPTSFRWISEAVAATHYYTGLFKKHYSSFNGSTPFKVGSTAPCPIPPNKSATFIGLPVCPDPLIGCPVSPDGNYLGRYGEKRGW